MFTPLCPGAGSGLSSLRLGVSLPSVVGESSKPPGLNTLMKAGVGEEGALDLINY